MKKRLDPETTLADRVLDAIDSAPSGLTDFELAARLDAYLSSINAARNALMKLGLVTRSGERRPSGRGGTAAVWVVAA